MTITLADAVDRVRARLDELTETAWSDEHLRSWINEGVRDVARKTETLITHADLDVEAGEQDIDAPTDVLRVHAAHFVYDNDSRIFPLEYRDFNAMDSVWFEQQAMNTADPRLFTTRGYPPNLKVVLYPRPPRDGTLKLTYYRLPDEFATDGTDDTETIEVVAGYEDLVVEYAAMLALRRDRDQRWIEHKAIYDEHLQAMIETTRRWSDQAGTVSRAGHPLPNWLTGYGYHWS